MRRLDIIEFLEIAEVTVDEVSAAAAEFFGPATLTSVVVGDAGSITEGLSALLPRRNSQRLYKRRLYTSYTSKRTRTRVSPLVKDTDYLHSMLEDQNIQHLISWSNSNESFVMSPSTEFSKVLA